MTEKSRELATLARYCVTKSPGFAAIALWVPYFSSDETDWVAYTDGKKVVAGEKFWEYAPLERAFILCHEILHVALRHLPRGAFAYRVSRAHGRIWNIACDAVINHALSQMSWLQTPADGVNIHEVLAPEAMVNRPAASWSAEAIYDELLKQIGLPPDEQGMEKWLDEWLDEHGLDSFDMVPGPGSESDLSDEIASRIWASRLARAQAGDRPGGLLRGLAGDFPISKTPWPQVLRSFMQDAVLPQSRENWNRPSRRTLAADSDVFEPATLPEYGIRRAGVVIDTSGSINDELLTRFCAEVGIIQARTGCEIVLISADKEVRTETVVKNDGRTFVDKVKSGQINFKGGGGTAFGPAISRLNRLKVSVTLYFTDLAGDFGQEKPVMPLLWCSTSPPQAVPFGRVIYLDSSRKS